MVSIRICFIEKCIIMTGDCMYIGNYFYVFKVIGV